MNFNLLEQLCALPGASGDEKEITDFIQNYVEHHSKHWKVQPKVIRNKHTQDAIILVFGDQPRTAIFAHVDVVGFTAGYGAQLIKVGGPAPIEGRKLVGTDSKGKVLVTITEIDEGYAYLSDRPVERGTPLTYAPEFIEEEDFIESNYIDNRLGVFNALKVAETLEEGVIVFPRYEEVGGGSAQVLGKYIYEKYDVTQALISDITWVTSGVQHHNGVAISTRDSGLPDREFVKQIIKIAQKHKIKYQLEVESAGGSDGNALQRSTAPFNWCFIGAPEDNVHSPNERVSKFDAEEMVKLYTILMKEL
jgi:putative aminopeptidase FrvX